MCKEEKECRDLLANFHRENRKKIQDAYEKRAAVKKLQDEKRAAEKKLRDIANETSTLNETFFSSLINK